MKNELIKRAQIGGYVKADTTGTNTNWEVGKITKTDDKSIWFESAVDGEEIKIARQHAFKATKAEFDAAAGGHDEDDNYESEADDIANVEADLADDEDDEDGEVAERSIVKRVYRVNYVNSYSAEGNSSKHNNDRVAIMLEGKNLDEVYDIVARATGETTKSLKERWAHLNTGQQRMLAGNKLRKFMKDQGTL